jgi:hypothetical protein
MIAVNETLGYELYPPGWQFCEIPVKSALRAVPAEGMTDTATIDALAEPGRRLPAGSRLDL